jgi:hypothetical protein
MEKSSSGRWFPPQYITLKLNQPVEDVPAKRNGA